MRYSALAALVLQLYKSSSGYCFSRCAVLRLQGFGETPLVQGLALLEMCSGDARLSKAALEFNMNALCMDEPQLQRFAWSAIEVRYSRHYDIMTQMGLLVFLQGVRRLFEPWFERGQCWNTGVGGHLWVGAPCSSWVWVARSSTRRCRNRVKGSKKVASVRKANKLLRRLLYGLLGAL